MDVRPVDAGRWDDLVALFGPSGAYSGCWCAGALLAAAVEHAAGQGATAVEGYPTDLSQGRRPPAAELYTGTVPLFERAGFAVARRPPTGRRVIMRRAL